jgi:hypothetical protein
MAVAMEKLEVSEFIVTPIREKFENSRMNNCTIRLAA